MNTLKHHESATALAPLLKTINQIARFYETLPNPKEAHQKMLKHLVAFWEPNMFLPLLEYLEQCPEGQNQYGALSPFAAQVLKLYSQTCLEPGKK